MPECRCGRLLPAECITTYRSGTRRWINYRCDQCGREWAQELEGADRSERVSADEVLSVHERLVNFEGPLTELLREV